MPSFDQMGSAYVMAHGIGVPVEDAKTSFTVPVDGEWHVWARTRDWTAPWKRGTSAGRLKLVVDGKTLPEGEDAALGTTGADWAWQKAGVVDLKRGTASKESSEGRSGEAKTRPFLSGCAATRFDK